MNNKNKSLLVLLFIAFFLISCDGGEMTKKNIQLPGIKDVSGSAWTKLSQRKIYFAHQSVGYNIIDGVHDLLKENPQIKLNIIDTNKPSDFDNPVFAHSKMGENHNPISKINDFESLMNKGVGSKVDIALLKFCFVDIDSKSDVDKIFSEYKKTILSLQKNHPGLILVHVTVPLLKEEKLTFKTGLKKIIGKKGGFFDNAHNIARCEFNERIHKEFGKKDPIFDLAKIESTYLNGKRSSFTHNGKTYFSLVPDYTKDGGHLNETGKKVVAEQLLILLSTL